MDASSKIAQIEESNRQTHPTMDVDDDASMSKNTKTILTTKDKMTVIMEEKAKIKETRELYDKVQTLLPKKKDLLARVRAHFSNFCRKIAFEQWENWCQDFKTPKIFTQYAVRKRNN